MKLSEERIEDSSRESKEEKDEMEFKGNSGEDFDGDCDSVTALDPYRNLPNLNPKRRVKSIKVSVVP